jgi:LysR family transcriptional regulator, transcriptional activator of the cysJI operon
MFTYSLNSLVVFYEVVKTHSFSKAADLLFMTQPGVSNHVAQLEAQTGSRLLVREKGGFKLTKEGKVIFKYAQKIEAAARGLENSLKALRKGEKPLLKIATTPVYSRIMMPFVLGSFQNANPDITINLDSGNSDDMVKTIIAMENDVVIVANQKPSQKLYSFPLIKEDLVLITGNGHPLSRKKSVSLSEIADYPLVIREEGSATKKAVLSAFDSMNIKPARLIDMRSTEFIKQWVSQGTGVSLLIKRAVVGNERKHLKVIPLRESVSLEVSVLCLKSRRYDKTIQRFLDHIKELKSKAAL